MKPLISILFLSIFALSAIKSYLPYADYIINYDYISKELCENKKKVELRCAGKCHLGKELEKASDENTLPNKQNRKKINLKEVLFSSAQIEYSLFVANNIQLKTNTFYQSLLPNVFTDIDVPPPKFI